MTDRGAVVTGWGTALPDRRITNADFEARLDTTDEWITERTGMKVRYHGGTTAGLAIDAGRRAMEMAGLTGTDIDYVLLCTTTPDWHVPASAARVQESLGITGGASDLNAACSGFVYGLVHAHALIGMGLRRILLIGSETLSRITDQEDRNTAILFADGAGAMVIEAVDGPGQLLSFDMGNDGTAIELLYCDIGDHLKMVGKEVFRRAVTVMVESARRSMEQAGVTADDLTLVVPHQANIRIIEAAASRLGLSMESVAVSIHRYGNTSSASIPLALVDAIDEGRVRAGDLVLLVGFGAGMSWASAVLRWPAMDGRTAS
ncbi:MAG: ketoacyl-ACP synthase III [Acidimicrobiia bacterium]|nr:ketoacyl-ACP synthase III [Acidimicrobiia bacterium]